MITHRDRVIAALLHQETDRAPMDFGGGPCTGIHPVAYDALLRHLGFGGSAWVASEQGADAVEICPAAPVLTYFDIDVRGVSVRGHEQRLDDLSYMDEWGVVWRQVDRLSAHTVDHGPLQRLDDPSASDLDSVPWPLPPSSEYVQDVHEQVLKLRAETDCAIVLNLWNCPFSLAQRIRGFTEFLEDLLLRPSFAEALLRRIEQSVSASVEALLAGSGSDIDCVSFADDLGIQTGPMISRDLYRKMIRPYHRRLFDAVRKHTDAYILLHSDGGIAELLPDLIDCGVQAINPVQVSAYGMDPTALKHRFGTSLSYWGGVDTHHVLPAGSPEEVTAEVNRRLSDLGSGGGLILATVHQIMAEVPPENIVAMFEAARRGRGSMLPARGLPNSVGLALGRLD